MASDMVKVFAIISASPTIICIMHLVILPGATNTSGKTILRDPKYTHHCTVPWLDWEHNLHVWKVVMSESVELFGLPGDKYITDIGDKSMTWSFRDTRDALLFKLKFGSAVE